MLHKSKQGVKKKKLLEDMILCKKGIAMFI